LVFNLVVRHVLSIDVYRVSYKSGLSGFMIKLKKIFKQLAPMYLKTRLLHTLTALFIVFAASSTPTFAASKSKQTITIAFLTQLQKAGAPTSNSIDPVILNKGQPGAELAIEDNNTTGEYTHQKFVLKAFVVPEDGNVLEVFNKQIAKKFDFLVVSLSPEATLSVADQEPAKNMLVFDAATVDDDLRNANCRTNLFHLLPSRAMRADALAQYLMKKRWDEWFLVIGNTKADGLYAEAIRRAAKRFGIKLVQEKIWEHTFEARRSAQSDVAVFTQVDDYHILMVADEQGEFGEYLDFRTWLPRPVAGTQGLVATAWHPTHEQWGATQIQNRFKEKAGRWMGEADYGAYLAVRALGEAATRSSGTDVKSIGGYLLSDQFALQGYKGTPLSFRPWDHQLRQPVLLAAPRAMVAVAPVEGFLHPQTELDTLGYDQPETGCHWSK
jgi:ABC transporter substrate binding protein (PQQ-dependent alcohol dehydrogenase system)